MENICAENIMVYIGIISFIWALTQITVVGPINKSLSAINKSIEALQVEVKEISTAMSEQRQRLALIEHKTDNLHEWVDRYEKKHDK